MAKVLISMREDFLARIDELADVEQRTRSELIRQALREYIRRKRKRDNGKASRTSEIVESILFD